MDDKLSQSSVVFIYFRFRFCDHPNLVDDLWPHFASFARGFATNHIMVEEQELNEPIGNAYYLLDIGSMHIRDAQPPIF